MVEAVDTLRFANTPVVVMKRELADIPLFGGVARAYGVIPVDRDAGAKALRELIALGKKAIADGRPVIIFPEGTRVPRRRARRRFGRASPASTACSGCRSCRSRSTARRVWPRGLVKHTGTIRFKVGETIPPGLKRERDRGAASTPRSTRSS